MIGGSSMFAISELAWTYIVKNTLPIVCFYIGVGSCILIILIGFFYAYKWMTSTEL